MKKKFYIISGIIVIIAAVTAVIFMVNRQNNIKTNLPGGADYDGNGSPNAGIVLNDVTWRSMSGGKLLWKLRMQDLVLNERTNPSVVKGLDSAELKNGDLTELTVRAGDLVRNNSNGNISMSSNVVIEGQDMRITTNSADWIDRSSLLLFNQPINATIGDFSLIADRVSYDVLQSVMEVSGRLELNVQGNNIVSQNGGRVYVDTERFDLNGPVSAIIRPQSLEMWLRGNNMPRIPEIPKEVRNRYNDYIKQKKENRIVQRTPTTRGNR